MTNTTPNELPAVAREALAFLNGAANPNISGKLMQLGFTAADLDEGWTLLRRATGPALNQSHSEGAQTVIERLDAWENKYYPLAQATLRRRYPAICDAIFLNLAQTDGPELLVTLETLHKRLEGLKESEEGRGALELLAQRGLTAAIIEQLGELLEEGTTLNTNATAALTAEAQRKAARAEAILELEAYLNEWRSLARTVITNRTHLRQLGLLSWRNDAPSE